MTYVCYCLLLNIIIKNDAFLRDPLQITYEHCDKKNFPLVFLLKLVAPPPFSFRYFVFIFFGVENEKLK